MADQKDPTLATALLGFQSTAPTLQRDKINPHFRSKYISLESLMEQVLPVLNENDLVLVQNPGFHETAGSDGQVHLIPSLTTTLIHVESGESIQSEMLLQAGKNDPQGQGAAITYARRQAAMSMLGLVADADDDGNRATPRAPAPARRTPQPRGATPTPDPGPDTPPPADRPTETPDAAASVEIANNLIAELQKEFGDHPEGMTWSDRMTAKTEEWFGTSNLAELNGQQAKTLVSRLRATRTMLERERDAAAKVS